MSLPDQAPPLPKTWFFVGDAVLVATAALIAHLAPDPFAHGPLIAIVACVVTGVFIAVIPALAEYARKQDEALDQRQRSLEALLAHVTTSAEQISIAATTLHQLTEVSQRNLKLAEHLPQRLHEKINEFNAQLTQAQDDEREELEKEVASLRASESEKLETISDKIHKSVAEFARLEATVNKHLTAARTELIERTDEALRHLSSATTSALAEAATSTAQAVRDAQHVLTTELDQRLAAACAAHVTRATEAIDRHLAASLPNPNPLAATPAALPPEAPEPIPETSGTAAPPPDHTPPEPEPINVAAPPASTAAAQPPSDAASPSVTATLAEQPSAENTPAAAAADEVATNLPPPPAPQLPRKRAPRKPKASEPSFDLGLDDLATSAPEEPASDPGERSSAAESIEAALSSDGATRLLVTAYIGIGNKLFLRGDGPGLSWEKGVPLQFVSIGKWRWETNDAATPVRGRLFKNDEIECSALGEIAVEPGQQREVSATF
ncbi:hypothetical protein K0B96_11295 [Horticoccus luteus]|uniref:Uncharacterized protein n=1 Tax=Horticoccus luteus TaxID=2862869 RepID=A0A8F9TTS8_9BACT|nr:hypothetical protein [Horticoccus luteus]QYM77901.1 hypothetical protein K0B96_11295 [Horticoccus luteus]